MSKDWNWLDRFVAWCRYSEINKYVKEGAVIADIGCGREGAFLLSHKNRISRGYGFDFRIKTHEDGNLAFINNREQGTLCLENESVDDVFLNAVLEHLENPIDILAEACRVLRPGGAIVMTTPTRIAKPILEFLAFRLHIINEDEILEHKHYYNRQDIVQLVAELNNSPYSISISLEKYAYFEFGVNSIIILRKS